ncbi:molybdate ABC transporter substrate-binding protein [Altererythrobacter xixiisoli]|uniref:Molybdate ABC transporter substrate-binding protein n=1 Tax=Croceibacterium xixiisoli TaxID=1476466 RepID=A0A6I4TS22_9SPHN|nr:molybdate ABC transporter substrate-binding protein [Croceibacterium xixiisoli]MXO97931.1 molybdate ABC transporter substrate-binding protein [Croceibacterium xixiisoli]
MILIRLRNLLLPLFAITLLTACAAEEDTQGPVVLAAASMQQAMDDVGAAWVAQGHAAPVVSTAASSALARQIEQGAPADLFISADEKWMDHLQRTGLLRTGTRGNIAGNVLVLIGRKNGGTSAIELVPGALKAALADGRLSMAEPGSVPAGRYGKAALEALGLWAEVAPQITPAENVRAALALVQRGEASLGIVYASDARTTPDLPVRAAFPQTSHTPILYPAAIIGASSHPDAAAFRAFLSGPEAAAILARHGFTPVPSSQP